jgi:cell wall-associated NlpC family hydrolase
MIMIEYAKHFITTPYNWGGNTPEEGMDCSGFIQEVIKSKYVYRGDRSSQDLLLYLLDNMVSEMITGAPENLEPEDICFYGTHMSKITHVSMYIGDNAVIESAGEGRIPTTKGMVRIRQFDHRSDFVCAVRLY